MRLRPQFLKTPKKPLLDVMFDTDFKEILKKFKPMT